MELDVPSEVAAAVDRGGLVVLNHSGGKDSQAMTALVRRIVPHAQLVVIHAPLGEIEWPGTLAHIEGTIGALPLVLAHAVDREGNRKRLLDAVRRRGKWPSPGQRWCTSDFKRGPIEREIRRWMRDRGFTEIVSCMGMRAEESSKRAKLPALAYSTRNSKAGRRWWDWLPIHALSTSDVFNVIHLAAEEPHWAYREGMRRLSCSFCIMACQSDLRTAARLRPDLYATYVRLEREIGHTLSMSRKPLDEIVRLPVV